MKRKAHLVSVLTREWTRLDNKARFILAVVDGELVVSKRRKAELLQDLLHRGFTPIIPESRTAAEEVESNDEDSDGVVASEAALKKGFDYLLSMPLWSLTMEKVSKMLSMFQQTHFVLLKVEKLRATLAEKSEELEILQGTSAEDMWLTDLDALESKLREREVAVLEAESSANVSVRGMKRKAAAKARAKKQNARDIGNGSDSDFVDKSSKRKSKTISEDKKPRAAVKKAHTAQENKPRAAAQKAHNPIQKKVSRAKQLTPEKSASDVISDVESEEDDETEVVASLADRLKKRMHVTPPHKSRNLAASTQSSATRGSSSESDDDAYEPSPKRKSRVRASKANDAVPVVGKKRVARRGIQSGGEDTFDFECGKSPAPKRARGQAKAKAKAKVPTKKTLPKKSGTKVLSKKTVVLKGASNQEPKTKALAKTSSRKVALKQEPECVTSESDDVASVKARTPKPTRRQASRVTYVELPSSGEESESSSSESEFEFSD